ncbi:MAG: hypothetical protein IAI50_03415 [Candidatus Eremiobacteraeota bacterium]|nr:hypothetical protein [Candidatus Eremiobacteraeota bacterium]
MEDVGNARLIGGYAFVSLDAAFRNVIDPRADYTVIITPDGDSNGLFVSERSPRGFSVRENHGGHSSIAFGYRIVAKPFGKREPRLPMIARHLPPPPALANHVAQLRSLASPNAAKPLVP